MSKLVCTLCFKCSYIGSTRGRGGDFSTHRPSVPHLHHCTFFHCLCDIQRWQMIEKERLGKKLKKKKTVKDGTADGMYRGSFVTAEDTPTLDQPVSPSQVSVIWDHLLLTNSALTIVSSPPSSPVLHKTTRNRCHFSAQKKNQWLVASLWMIKTRWQKWFFFLILRNYCCATAHGKKNNPRLRHPALLSNCRVCFQSIRSL